MRLFGYYAIHSFVNQLKKILKPGILIFILVCGLMGGLIGFGVARLEETSETRKEEMVESEEEIPEDEPAEEEPEITGAFPIKVEDGVLIFDTEGVYFEILFRDAMELLLLLVILVVIFYSMLSADKNGSKIFLMADVNLLFSAPMKPQSVLLFRLMCQFGTMLLATFYLTFQIPNLVLNAGLSIWSCVALLLVWFGTLIVSKLLQIMLYTIFSTHIHLKKYLSPAIYGTIFLILAGYAAYVKTTGLGYVDGAVGFFNSPASRWIPFVGWLKGLFLYTSEENFAMAAAVGGLLIIAVILLGIIIWKLKADFYEDAMAKSQETASLQEAAKEGRTIVFKAKTRSEKIKRNDFNRGYGASVFFTKSLYNRFRFARFGIFTKTVLTYLAVVGGAWFLNWQFATPFTYTIIVMAIGVFVFFRGLGNPLGEDTMMSFFIMIPENTWLKLFWSVLAGTVNCLLDILPALVLAAILTRTAPLQAMAWIFFLLSVDLYSSIVSSFIGLAIPQSIGQTLKTLIIILFVYFGLLPDILAIALGYVFEHVLTGILAAVLANIVLSAIFYLLTPLFLEPKKGSRPDVPVLDPEKVQEAKKVFAWLAFAAAVILGGGSLLQIGLVRVIDNCLPSFWDNSYALWIATFFPIYLIAFPVGIVMMKKVPARTLEQNDWSLGQMVRFFFVCVGFMYLGNLIGALVNFTIGLYLPQTPINPLETFATEGALWIRILFLVILAPCLEELIFRKTLIDRMSIYGEKAAIVTSAVMFGLFHGNFSQFFYATALGIIFAYVYVRSGKLRYSIALHMIINFMGSIFSVWLLEHATMDLETLDALGEGAKLSFATWGFLGYVLFMILGSVAGLLILGICRERIHFLPTETELGKGQVFKTAFLNWGMGAFMVVSGVLFWMAL